MNGRPRALPAILAGSMALVAILMLGAVIDASGASGTCMFILVPLYTAVAVVYPLIVVRRFGTGILVYLPYALIGFFPLYFFDYLQSGALVGLWAVFLWSATGPIIGLFLDLTTAFASRLSPALRAITAGTVMQTVTFFLILLGFTYLYRSTAAGVGHLHFFNREWLFTLPWMAANGAVGGYAAHLPALRPAFRNPTAESITGRTVDPAQ
jgi:hypothetical protein